ncbi:Na/Pi cotransporter family protein [Kurthia sibirica]|uniref:Sodium-dependent phosphate transporter n=1 Tax=Kurthia sibirica TaxID=202750 RepID=A0A2U3AN87_9BACL|nr:Na/Pi cotransporter family protein [Kurthia sibirica]PWI26004.1 sodium-dependent phosphate transporter [Kurthia sibirica]GEK35277.1 sodium:phosphate symporter [Kurthia sibirica]
MELNYQQMIFQFLGGLGLFLFAIKFMGDGLQKAAGDRLRSLLDRFTTNPIKGILVGIFVTALIQSSSGTTVIAVGLVSAGFMTLRQSIGVIMGANIGTTVTAFIIGIDVGEYAFPILALGAVMLFFFKQNNVQNIGQIIFGFGGLFVGLNLMSDGMAPLRDAPVFTDMMLSMSEHATLGVVVGTVFTFIVQSSSATIGILQGLYADGLIDLKGALPVLFGDNIGTTITVILASLGASISAKRAAATHVLFNVFGTIIFMLLLTPFIALLTTLTASWALEPKMEIAFAHGIFNIVNTLIQLPLIGVWAYIVTKIIPGKEDMTISMNDQNFDYSIIEKSPNLALAQAKDEIVKMGNYSVEGLRHARLFLQSKKTEDAAATMQLEVAINTLDNRITEFLVAISKRSLSTADSIEHVMLLDLIRDFERIGDHVENLVELIEYKDRHRLVLSEVAREEIYEMFDYTIDTVLAAIDAFENTNIKAALEVLSMEDNIDMLERKLRKRHIHRMNEGLCTPAAGIVFADIISNLERVGDHASNVAKAVLEYKQK